MVGLGVEPDGLETEREAAQGIALAAADDGSGQFVVACLGSLSQLMETVDVVLWLGSDGIGLEAEALVKVQRLVDFVELLRGLVAFGLLDDALADEDGIVLRSVLHRCLPVLRLADPADRLPAERVKVQLGDGASHDGQVNG